MTPTEQLRRMLDERGLEHIESEDSTTIFFDAEGNKYTYHVDPKSGWAQLYGYHITPAQAIAATVENPSGGFDEARYREVCRLLEEATSAMAEWGC